MSTIITSCREMKFFSLLIRFFVSQMCAPCHFCSAHFIANFGIFKLLVRNNKILVAIIIRNNCSPPLICKYIKAQCLTTHITAKHFSLELSSWCSCIKQAGHSNIAYD